MTQKSEILNVLLDFQISVQNVNVLYLYKIRNYNVKIRSKLSLSKLPDFNGNWTQYDESNMYIEYDILLDIINKMLILEKFD